MSTYGAELLVAARIAVDMVIELWYMLCMLGVPVDGPSLMLGDTNSVVLNTSVPASVLKKMLVIIEFAKQLLVGLSTLSISRVKQILRTC